MEAVLNLKKTVGAVLALFGHSLQNQLQNPALITLKNLIRYLTTRLDNGYCRTTVANYRLITVIRFVAKSYTNS